MGLGSSYGELGQFEEAIEAYLEATQLGPNYAKAQFGLGWSYFQLEKYDKALMPLKIAVKVEPQMTVAHFTLGKVFAALGSHRQAIEEYKKNTRHHTHLSRRLFSTGT